MNVSHFEYLLNPGCGHIVSEGYIFTAYYKFLKINLSARLNCIDFAAAMFLFISAEVLSG